MKLVSPKTLLACLLCIVFIIMKVMTFDGLQDLFWIIFLGYLTIKGLIVAFSQEAYDEDMKKAYQGKALYRDLFGRFAYIATDIPLITLLLAGLLALFCPVTTLLKVTLVVLLIFAVGYAVWLSWYISKHKRLRIENGEWGTAVLTKEDEQAWARSNRWHNFGLCMFAVLCALYLIFGDPRIYINNNKLEDAFTMLTTDSVTLEEIVPFEWTTVYTFDPYTSIDRIEWITGSKSPALQESVSEGMTHFVFMNRGRVMASVCAYPSSVGYSLSFAGGKNIYYDYTDGGYSHIECGDLVEFKVTQDDGIVRLYAFMESDSLEPISSDMFGEDLYNALQKDWAAYDALSAEHKMLSSHIPGNCKQDFDNWDDCEAFIGFPVFNPLEGHSGLEKGTYVGMPIGFMDAPHIQASWYGTRDGHVEWVSIQSGYRHEEIRIVVDAKLYGDPAEDKSTDKGWSTELDRQWYLANVDSDSPIITEDSTEKYVANTAYLARGDVLYSIRVIGETTAQNEVQETLEQVLPCFDKEA